MNKYSIPYYLIMICALVFVSYSYNETNTTKSKENTIEPALKRSTPSVRICRRLKEETIVFIEQRRNIESRSRYVDSVYYSIEFIKSKEFESKIIIATTAMIPELFPEYCLAGYMSLENGTILVVDDTLKSNAKYYSCFDLNTDTENLPPRLTISFHTPQFRKDFAIKNDSIFVLREYGFP